MRHSFLSAVIMFTLSALYSPQPTNDVTLELGYINVWLGMSKADVLKAANAAGYSALETGDSTIIYLRGKEKSDFRSYTVAFKEGRLSFASRSWYRGGDGFDAVIGAMATLDGQSCKVSNASVNKPDMKANRVLVTCGDRSVMILKGTAKSDHIADVIERIGTE